MVLSLFVMTRSFEPISKVLPVARRVCFSNSPEAIPGHTTAGMPPQSTRQFGKTSSFGSIRNDFCNRLYYLKMFPAIDDFREDVDPPLDSRAAP
ncbi:MAG: hypothetical protein AB7F32_11060, partial [Victivallaceae bacterium]